MTNKVPNIRFKGFTDDWEQRKLSELATMHARIGWQNLRTSEFLDQGDYMLVTGTDFENDSINFSTCHYVQKERYDQDKHIQISNGSILITKDGTLGKVAYVQGLKKPATLNAGVFNVEIKDENRTDGKYLFQYLKAPFLMEYVEKNATGGTIKHLNQNILVNFPVAISEKSEQQKIGEYFSNLDHLITLHQRKCEQTKELKKFMLQKIFPKKGEKNPEIRFPGFTDDWEQRKFGELYEKVSRKNDMTYGTEQIISVANMYYKVDANVKRQDYLKTYNIFELGDIAFEGNKSKHFAHGRFVENTIGNGIVSHVFDVFKPIMDFNLSFWKYYINYEGVMGPILTRVTKASTMMTNLVAKDFLNEDILVPSIAEQQKIGEYLSNLDHLINLHQRKCEQLKELKKFMLQNMFPKKG
ncbi:restriction endonuclease subunit S [Streptococcus equinus]|uniref:restriction endonuclease subunit S n=1 Tax=Streptococcus equinus TaxID=1335 RepID=UPI00237B87B9|nr:restriction endonuclease subunit S [Streptococcus equinus]